MLVYDKIQQNISLKKRVVWILIDPDKLTQKELEKTILMYDAIEEGVILMGGSFLYFDRITEYISLCRKISTKKVVLFPGNPSHFNQNADALLYLSLISGRNPETLIGYHVISAPLIKKSGVEVIPTGYMLIDGGNPTSVSYMSNTFPIPHEKNEIAISTAIAGELLGLKLIYLDAGSGAKHEVSSNMINSVKKNITLPLIVGGGINTKEKCLKAFESGADIVVVGNAIEKNRKFIEVLKNLI